MIGVLGEDKSDAESIKHLIRSIAGSEAISVKTKGCGSRGAVLQKGLASIGVWQRLGMRYFVICLDADCDDPEPTRSEVITTIIRPAGIDGNSCCVIPVQELEAWILADLDAVRCVIPSWRPKPVTKNPETIPDPKEYLEHLSRAENKKPRYSHATHNEIVAQHLNIDKVYRACPSFRVLRDFVRTLA